MKATKTREDANPLFKVDWLKTDKPSHLDSKSTTGRRKIKKTVDEDGHSVTQIKEIHESDQKQQISHAIGRLNTALKRRARELEQCAEDGLLTKEYCTVVEDFFQDVIKAVDLTTHNKKRARPPTQSEAKSLRVRAKKFISDSDQAFLGASGKLILVKSLANELADDVLCYCNQIELIFAEVRVVDGMILETNLHRDPAQMAIFMEVGRAHAQIHQNGSYPTYADMKAKGFTLSDRTYRSWKKLHSQGHYSFRIIAYKGRK